MPRAPDARVPKKTRERFCHASCLGERDWESCLLLRAGRRGCWWPQSPHAPGCTAQEPSGPGSGMTAALLNPPRDACMAALEHEP